MSSRPAFFALCLGIALLCGSCGDSSSGRTLQVPAISPKTDLEYVQALEVMRDAWRARPREINAENLKAEQRFIARLMSIANRTKGTDNFKATSLLWREVVSEHQRDYPEKK